MGDIISQLGLSLVSSAAVLSVFALVARKLVEKWIDTVFAKRLEALKRESNRELEAFRSEFEVIKHAKKLISEQRIIAYAQLSTLVYTSKNLIAQYCDDLAPDETSDAIQAMAQLHESFSESLYGHRFLLPTSLFNALHSYKKLIEDFKVLLLLVDSDPSLFEDYRVRLRGIASAADSANPKLITQLQEVAVTAPPASTGGDNHGIE